MDSATQHIKSITVLKQVIRADGTREEIEMAAYMDRDPAEMARVIEENDVKGRCTSGGPVVELLNDVPLEDAKRISAINEAQGAKL